jgi:hypothetical protein
MVSADVFIIGHRHIWHKAGLAVFTMAFGLVVYGFAMVVLVVAIATGMVGLWQPKFENIFIVNQ